MYADMDAGEVIREWADLPLALTTIFILMLCVMRMVPRNWLCITPRAELLGHIVLAFAVATALTVATWWFRVAAFKPVPVVHDGLKAVGIRGAAYAARGQFEWTYIFRHRNYDGWLWSLGSFALTVFGYLLLLAAAVCAVILANTPPIADFIMRFAPRFPKSPPPPNMRLPKMLVLAIAFCAAYRAIKVGNNKLMADLRKETTNRDWFEDLMLASTWACLAVFLVGWCGLMVLAWLGRPMLPKPHVLATVIFAAVIAAFQLGPPLGAKLA